MDISYETWFDTYRPLTNADGEVIFFETYGKDMDIVTKTNPHLVWTLVDGGDYSGFVTGIELVNRLNFVICANPWEDEELYVDTYELTLCDFGQHVWVDHKRYDGTPVVICSECEQDKTDLDELSEVA